MLRLFKKKAGRLNRLVQKLPADAAARARGPGAAPVAFSDPLGLAAGESWAAAAAAGTVVASAVQSAWPDDGRAPGPESPGREAPNRVAREAEASPAQALPAEALPAEALPERALPGRALPTQPLPTQPLPTQPLPTQPLPAGARPATAESAGRSSPRQDGAGAAPPGSGPTPPGSRAPRAPGRDAGGASGPPPAAKLSDAFDPGRPKKALRAFAGRRDILERLMAAVQRDGAHLVIFGPRGTGKTSLANVLSEAAGEAGLEALRYACAPDATFQEIVRGLLRSRYAGPTARVRIGAGAPEGIEAPLPTGGFAPADLPEILERNKLERAILVLDEFDRAESKRLKKQLADAIKTLSLGSAGVSFVIVGAARRPDDLIVMDPALEDRVVAVNLPLMTAAELDDLVQAGAAAADVRFEAATRQMIVSIAKGLPYFAQLLCLHAGRRALGRGSGLVEMADLRDALQSAVRDFDPAATAAYEAATRQETDQGLIDVLSAAAAAPFDDFGAFTAEDAAARCAHREGEEPSPAAIAKSLAGLARAGKSRLIEEWETPGQETRYLFVPPALRQYILLRQAVRQGLM
jgi:hypothetical protein